MGGSLPVAVACALVPLASLRALGAPLGLAIAAAVAVFPVLPVAWHLLAERKRSPRLTGPGTAFERLALRCLALGLIVLTISFANLGVRRVGDGLAGLFGVRRDQPAGPPAPRPGAPVVSVYRHELESFIPADASLVVAMSGASVLQQLLTSLGADTGKTATALQRCQILTDRAVVLVATRDPDTRLIALRAPGITDQRNLYCVVGFLGNDRLGLKFTRDRAPVRFELQGLLGKTLVFEAADDRTVVAAEGGLAGQGPQEALSARGRARPTARWGRCWPGSTGGPGCGRPASPRPRAAPGTCRSTPASRGTRSSCGAARFPPRARATGPSCG